jgi:hypothetical protein
MTKAELVEKNGKGCRHLESSSREGVRFYD